MGMNFHTPVNQSTDSYSPHSLPVRYILNERGKAAGLDNITVEHLRFTHYMLYCVLCKLFNFMIHCSHVPDCFGMSYTVPVMKNNVNTNNKTMLLMILEAYL